MVDTGLYAHPHHRAHGYTTSVVPAVTGLDPAADERGHGTAMSALLLAVAPRAELTMVKMANEAFSFPLAAFQRAVSLEPDVVSCSWGTLREEPQLHLEVADAVRRGSPSCSPRATVPPIGPAPCSSRWPPRAL